MAQTPPSPPAAGADSDPSEPDSICERRDIDSRLGSKRAIRRHDFRLGVFELTCAVIALTAYRIYGTGDFGMFYADATRWLDTGALYGPITGRPTNLNLPHVAVLFVPLTVFPELIAWVLWQCMLLMLGGDIVRRVVPDAIRSPLILTVMLAVSPATLSQIAMGQLGWLVAWLVTLSWQCHHANPRRSAIWLGLGIALKPFLLVIAGWWLLRRRFREASLALAVALSVGGLGIGLLGAEPYQQWVLRVGAISWHTLPLNWSIIGVLSRWDIGQAYIITAEIFAILVASVLLSRTSTLDSRGWTLALTTCLLVAPLAWAYYAWILVGPTLAWLTTCDSQRGARLTLFLLWVPSALSTRFPFSTLGLIGLATLAARPPRLDRRFQQPC